VYALRYFSVRNGRYRVINQWLKIRSTPKLTAMNKYIIGQLSAPTLKSYQWHRNIFEIGPHSLPLTQKQRKISLVLPLDLMKILGYIHDSWLLNNIISLQKVDE
jgi:hypothetical protein